jgi:diguanylate cyclase (GGDEF)-like protein
MSIESEHKNLEEQIDRANRELTVLYDISKAMRMTLELNQILYIILTGVTAHRGLGFNRAILFLVNKEKRELECKMVIGPESGKQAQEIWQYFEAENPKLEDLITNQNVDKVMEQSSLYQSLKELKIPLDKEHKGLLTEAYFHGTPLHIKPEDIDQYRDDPILQKFHTKELVVMPLKAQDEIKGLVVADNFYTQKPITGDDLKIFSMLANHAGLAIENSFLYEMVVHRSRTDSLTRLWNHGFFQDRLAEEIERAKRNHHPLGLLIIDIDDFKKLNDTFGHQNGDIVLREIADLLKKSSRDIDYVCRYGGEEFSVILIETNADSSYIIAERIRENIAQHTFPKFSSDHPLKVTISIGLATFPENGQTKEELINQADKAMYIAKFSGKNRTCLADGR